MKSVIINVKKIEIEGYDEDDRELSTAKGSTVHSLDWIIDVADVMTFGISSPIEITKKKKIQPLEIWFTNADTMLIDIDIVEFTEYYLKSREIEVVKEETEPQEQTAE